MRDGCYDGKGCGIGSLDGYTLRDMIGPDWTGTVDPMGGYVTLGTKVDRIAWGTQWHGERDSFKPTLQRSPYYPIFDTYHVQNALDSRWS